MRIEEMSSKREWETFVCSSDAGTFYHSLKWKEVIQKSFPFSALYLTIKDANGTLVGICPGFIQSSLHAKIYHSIPYSDYGGPVIARHCVKQAPLSLLSFLQSSCSDKDVAYAKFCFMDDELERFFKCDLSNRSF